jgi:uncharacterized RDD family membrane protein YckC
MSQTKTFPSSRPVRLAGFLSRLIAFGLDMVFINLINLVVLIGINLTINFFSMGNLAGPPALQNIIETIVTNFVWLASLFSTFFGAIYLIFFWVISGFTPGKALLGLRVVRSDGQKLHLGRAILRLIGYFIAALPLFLGFVWILFDNRRQGWHDKIAGTYVIYMWEEKSHSLTMGSSEPTKLSASRQ